MSQGTTQDLIGFFTHPIYVKKTGSMPHINSYKTPRGGLTLRPTHYPTDMHTHGKSLRLLIISVELGWDALQQHSKLVGLAKG